MGIVRKCAQKLSEKLNGENWVGGNFGRKHGRATRSSRYRRDIANWSGVSSAARAQANTEVQWLQNCCWSASCCACHRPQPPHEQEEEGGEEV